MVEFLIAAVPLLLLLGSLLLGRYPGCETAVRLAERIAARARSKATVARNWRRPRLPGLHTPHGGLLIAFGLAQRPPPRAI
ncbi:MAG TPA: hypothetical protein VFN89_03515 [Solirubrobacterales bacterium]|nr:hypothetical protein [Solirubrobacterales bacterium]